MWFKDIPEGQKVTDKLFRRVLISSVCSILLCMVCLVGATWAWFTVSIENTGNEIKIGEPKINMMVDGEDFVSGTALNERNAVLQLAHGNDTDDFDKKSTLYVTLTLQCGDETSSVYVVLNEKNGYCSSVNVQNESAEPCTVSWIASWLAPVNAAALIDDTIIFEAEESTAVSTSETTESSAESSTEETTGATTEETTEETTASSAEPSETEAQPETEGSEEPPVSEPEEPEAAE